jgi:hypothetical protein
VRVLTPSVRSARDKPSDKASQTSRRLLRTADVSMVVDGLLYLPSVRRLPFGGRDVTEHLQRLLAARGVVVDDLSTLQVSSGVEGRPSDVHGDCAPWSPSP